jgi:peptidoglycan/LPS O-acetylase OafA/YrhL
MGGLAENTKLSIICLFCGSLLVMAVSSSPKQIVGWFFTLPFMRFFGKYSYGLYIFHELFNPLFNGPLGVHTIGAKFGVNWYIAMFLHFIVAALIAIGVSLVSWHVLEKHMLKLKRYFEHAPEPRAATAAAPAPAAHPVTAHAPEPTSTTAGHQPVPMTAASSRMAG